jgi:hypothetical protein
LRVSLPLVSTLVLPVLADFMREYPEIQLDLDFSDRLVDVIDEGFDAVVRTGEPADSRLTARKLGHFQMVLVASPEYLAAHGTPRNVQDLQSHRCLHFRWPHSGKLEAWPLPPGADGEPHGPGFHGLQQHRDPRLLRPAGRGIACLPDFAIREPLADGRLVRVMPGQAQREGVFHILWPAGRHVAPKSGPWWTTCAPGYLPSPDPAQPCCSGIGEPLRLQGAKANSTTLRAPCISMSKWSWSRATTVVTLASGLAAASGPSSAHMVDDGALVQVLLACSGHRVTGYCSSSQPSAPPWPSPGVDLRAACQSARQQASLNQSEGLAAQ